MAALDRLEQLELRAAAVKVVFGSARFVILVAVEEVGQEAHALFERDQLAGGHQMGALGRGEHLAGGFEISAGQGLKQR